MAYAPVNPHDFRRFTAESYNGWTVRLTVRESAVEKSLGRAVGWSQHFTPFQFFLQGHFQRTFGVAIDRVRQFDLFHQPLQFGNPFSVGHGLALSPVDLGLESWSAEAEPLQERDQFQQAR